MTRAPSEEDRQALELARRIFEERVPFNRVLGVELEELSFEAVRVKFAYREDLVGNFLRKSLHGGVISAALDLTGGIVAFVGALESMEGGSVADKKQRLANVGTIDLRVDYLRPGIGSHFLCSGRVLRVGNKVAVVRMELVNDTNELIAVATGTYLIG
jgi:uncharacterized protein (TIGR00369 family)